jgi:hypothetical protein
MTHRAQLLILALFIVLLLLAILFPRPAASDAPVVASAVPASAFVAIRSAEPLASGQASISADPQPRTTGAAIGPTFTAAPQGALPGGQRPAPSPSAPRPVSVAPVSRHPVGRQSASSGATPATGSTAPSVTGTASWFRSPRGVSAAGPALRTALGSGWRGTRVRVTGPAGSAWTTLGDWMAADRLIDLDDDVFPAVCGPLSRGICRVEVNW